ncbi:phage baseplate plug family protein, partial [Burkholderia multivorans]|uniref:phage baseplate plug family protein n=1 Tax=Burkholderia multivorans TaxID=87883 RepID=UPI003C12BFB0
MVRRGGGRRLGSAGRARGRRQYGRRREPVPFSADAMTTLVPFQPSNATTPPFQATVTLDGVAYSLSVTWNIAGMRWYVTLTDQNGNIAWNGA